MYITHENHFKFGWGNGTYNFDDQNGQFWVKFGQAKYMPTSFREECVRAARLIGENATSPILICYSGGIDSEVVVRSFEEAGVPFEVAIMKLSFDDIEDTNYYDTKFAFDHVRANDIKSHVVTIDMINFFRNILPAQLERYKSNVWGVILHSQLVKQFPNHHIVMGGGDIYLQRHRYNGRPKLEGMFLEEELISIAPIEMAHEVGATGINNRFFMHTPELMLAWLTDPDVSHWIKYEEALYSKFTSMNYFAIKPYTIYRHWPDMPVRPKYTGFERIMHELRKNTEKYLDIKLFLDNVDIFKKTEIVIDLKDLMQWLQPDSE